MTKFEIIWLLIFGFVTIFALIAISFGVLTTIAITVLTSAIVISYYLLVWDYTPKNKRNKKRK